ncbi:transcriptional regulator BetI [Pararhizobium sp.]|uniref:transcriptional regulator BetI n=1 Tax=Pararhizobium sp. TaxID=1977563 RepID=UPI003D0CB4D4
MTVQPKKQKKRIEEIRRIELIEAAHRIFIRDGLKGLTTTRICNEAGMSQGILTYYFKDKDEVLFEMVRHANRILMDEVVMRLRGARTRWDRIIAVIDGNFPETRFERNTANAWVSFYAEAAHNQRYARLQRLFYRRLHSNLASALVPAVDRADIDPFVLGFAAMLDGIWLRRGHSDADISLAQGKQLLTRYTENSLGAAIVGRLQSLLAAE